MATEPYVLEFSLGERRYCMDISYVDEIVDADEEITPVPTADPQVVGVVDLRGTTTTVVDPKVTLNVDGETTGRRIIVLGDSGGRGLLVDDVHQVARVDAETVDDTTAMAATRGVIRREDRFVVWIDPSKLHDFEADSQRN